MAYIKGREREREREKEGGGGGETNGRIKNCFFWGVLWERRPMESN
jgi:hypothetical protein